MVSTATAKNANAKRVAQYKFKNPNNAKKNKLKETVARALKRLSDPKYDEAQKERDRIRKKKQRADKKKSSQSKDPASMAQVDSSSSTPSNSGSSSTSPVMSFGSSTEDSFACSSYGESSSSPPTDGSFARPLDVNMTVNLDEAFMDISDLDESSPSIPPLESSTPDRLTVRIPLRDKSYSLNISRQAKYGQMTRKKNNKEKSLEIQNLRESLGRSEDENFEKDLKIAELNNQIRNILGENEALKDKLDHADDWIKTTYKYMTPIGRSELRNGAFLAREEFPKGTLSRIRNNTGLNLSKSPTASTTEDTALSKAVKHFAMENSSEVPDMKAAKKGIRYFYCYKYVLWIQFKSSQQDISYSQFCSYWPQNIIKPKIEDFGSCKCIPCENSQLLVSALKRQEFLSREHELDLMIKDMRAGDNTFEEQFKADLNNLKTSDKKDQTVSFLSWQKVQKEGAKRDVVHRIQKTVICSQAAAQMEELYENLKNHLNRNCEIKKTIKERRESVMASDDQAFIHMDWAENLEIKTPGEVQSAFFSHTSVSLHTSYLYSKEDSGGSVSLSDSSNHKAESIIVALRPMIQKLVDRGIKHIVCVSDSPTSQYRNCKMVWLVKELAVYHQITIEWLYTEAGHGKSCCDGIGGTIKSLLRDLLAFNTSHVVSCAKDVLGLIEPHTTIDLSWHDSKDIEDVQKTLPSLGSLVGALKIHKLDFDVLGNIKAKSLPSDPISSVVKLKILRNNNNRRIPDANVE